MNVKQNTGYQDFEWAVKLNRCILSFIGLWPEVAPSPRRRLLCNVHVFTIILGLIFILLMPSVQSLIRIYGDAVLLMDNLQYSLPLLSSLIRIIIFWWKKEVIVEIVNMLEEDWIEAKTSDERNLMIKKAHCARLILMCGCYLMLAGFVLINILPCFGFAVRIKTNITDPGRSLPLQTHYMYDVTKTPYFELTFTMQCVFMIYGAFCYTGIDNFLGLLIFHICGQLDILKDRLTCLHKYVNFHQILRTCVMKHIRLFRAIEIIEDTYNTILLFLFIYFGVLFAFYGFQIISVFDKDNAISLTRIFFYLSTLINVFAHMCLYCALGDILVIHCNEVYYAAYDNEWYSIESNLTKDLLPILIRRNKPVCLTAGKMFPLTMATFCDLIKTSFGYISMLHTMRN